MQPSTTYQIYFRISGLSRFNKSLKISQILDNDETAAAKVFGTGNDAFTVLFSNQVGWEMDSLRGVDLQKLLIKP